MSILACLIGILTLMINASMQVQEANREKTTEEDQNRAIENRDLLKKANQLTKKAAQLDKRIQEERQTVAELAKLKDRRISLELQLKEIDKAGDPKKADAELQKATENLKKEIAALKKERPPLNKRIAELAKKIKERKEAPKPPESVLVRPGGVGFRGARNLFFVECNSTGIVLHYENGSTKAIARGAITTNGDYRNFLTKVKETRDSMVLYLIRKTGNESYLWAAGFAQNKYEVDTGKLPLPNDGKIDLSLFRR